MKTPSRMNEAERELYERALDASVATSWRGAVGVVLAVDGTVEAIPVDFARAKRAIGGGYIEVVQLASGNLLLVDEDGLSKGLPLNVRATAVAIGQVLGMIVGPAVFVPRHHAKRALA